MKNGRRKLPSDAWFKSASSKIKNGQLPPSSSVTFFKPSEHSLATNFPTLVCTPVSSSLHFGRRVVLTDPVNVTFLMSGCRQRASLNGGVFSRLVVRTLKTPFGNPACSAKFPKASTERGVSGEGFTIIVQPAARAAPAFLKIILHQSATHYLHIIRSTYAIGKFHGTNAAATPIGCFTVKTLLPGAAGV